MPYKSKIANLILQTPFDNKSAPSEDVPTAITAEDFFERCYIGPRFMRVKDYIELEEERTIDIKHHFTTFLAAIS